MKLTSTAAIEIELLNVFHRRVNSVITVALTSGASRISHGTIIFGPLNTQKDAKFLELEIDRFLGSGEQTLVLHPRVMTEVDE